MRICCVPQGSPATILHPSNDFHWVSKVFFPLRILFLSLEKRIMRYFPWDVLTQCVLKRPEKHKDRMWDREKAVIRQKKYSAGVFLTACVCYLFSCLLQGVIGADGLPNKTYHNDFVQDSFTDQVYICRIFSKCYLKNFKHNPNHFLSSWLFWWFLWHSGNSFVF